ncbi:pilin [Patescibacteria group bacterium]|nr:pilin [Patescibacteria group bacterium]
MQLLKQQNQKVRVKSTKRFDKFFKTAIRVIFFIALIAVFGLEVQVVLAQQLSLGIEYGSALSLATRDVREIVVSIINVLLGFLGVAAILIILYGGYLYMTSGGDESKIEKAKKILINGAIGLLIILAAFGIVTFIVNKLAPVTMGPPGAGQQPGYTISGGALGGGVLEAVYPEPGATNIPRNTMIMVMFNEAMDIDTIIKPGSNPPQCSGITVPCGYLAGDSQDPNVKIVNQTEGSDSLAYNQVIVTASSDHKNYVFDPIEYLGNANSYTYYSVNLSDAIMRANGFSAFMAGGYTWTFQVSNILDLTPPFITDVIPVTEPGQTVFKNTIVQINFNEAINVVAAGLPGNIVLTDDTGVSLGAGPVITGTSIISNLFKTVEFVSSEQCLDEFGNLVINSCGLTPYCLPGDATITALIKAALVNTSHEVTNPLSGINDAAANSLDGGIGNTNDAQDPFCEVNLELTCNLNGQADGRPPDSATLSDQFNTSTFNDNYWWRFNTNNQMDLDPPEVITVWIEQGALEIQESLSPDDESVLVPRNKTIKAIFDEYIMSSTLNTTNFKIFNETLCDFYWGSDECDTMIDSDDWPDEVSGCDYSIEHSCIYPRGGFTISKNNYSTLQTINPVGTLEEVTKATLNTYSPYLDGLERYNPRITSDVKDMYQNCFFDPSVGYPVGP